MLNSEPVPNSESVKGFERYLPKLLIIGLPIIAAGAWICSWAFDTLVMAGFLAGAGISLTNAVFGYLFLAWGLKRSLNSLLMVVVGGFLARLFLAMILMATFMFLTRFNPYSLGLAIAGFYFLFTAIELFAMRRRLFPTQNASEVVSSSS